MSSTRCELLNWLLLPLVAIAAAALAIPLSQSAEVALLWVLTIVAVVTHLHYGYGVVRCSQCFCKPELFIWLSLSYCSLSCCRFLADGSSGMVHLVAILGTHPVLAQTVLNMTC